MHLINQVEGVALHRDVKADALLNSLFMKGEMVAPGAFCDTLPQVP